MTHFYAGFGGNDAWAGTSWPTRKATIGGLLGVAYVPGDRLIVGPGVYRETVTLNGNGIAILRRGCLSVTEGSKIVTGTDTNWLPAVQPGDWLNIPWLAYGLSAEGSDGAGDGAGGFTSVGAEFQPNSIGFVINIQTQGSYFIAAMAGAGPPHDAITLTDINAVGWPGAGNWNFWVPSNEGSYEIESVDSATQLTLTRPWSGPTYTWTTTRYKGGLGPYGTGYTIYRPVYLIGDETGELTDGAGGICRITGSDTDLTRVRPHCIYGSGKNYWTIRGFQLDTTLKTNDNGDNIKFDDGEYITLEDIRSTNPFRQHIFLNGDLDRITVRRCSFFGGIKDDGVSVANFTGIGISLYAGSMRWEEYGLHVENCLFDSQFGVMARRYANVTMKSCETGMSIEGFAVTDNISLGGCFFVHTCEMHYVDNIALWAQTNQERILGDWNNFWDNANDSYVGTVRGPNSTVDLHAYLPELPILVDGYRYRTLWYASSEWWSMSHVGGLYAANEDIWGVPRPELKTKRSRGCFQNFSHERDTDTTYGGEESCLYQPDAMRTQLRAPTTGVELTVSAQVNREANYAGSNPKLVVYQKGQPEAEAVSTVAVDTWEELRVTFTPNVYPPWIRIEMVSENTAAGADIGVRWQWVKALPPE